MASLKPLALAALVLLGGAALRRRALTVVYEDAPGRPLDLVGARDIFRQEDDTNHLGGTARMGFDARTGVVDADCRCWDIPNLWVCDGSVFPHLGRGEPVAHHNGDRAAHGRAHQGPRWAGGIVTGC